MPYTPPTQRSPAASASSSPTISRRSSYQAAGLSRDSSSTSSTPRPELPRSASYLTRHRRTTSVNTASLTSSSDRSEPTPPGTANSELSEDNSFGGHGSIRQSPPPASEDIIPRGAIMSPPESTNNSSDDDDDVLEMKRKGRQLENLAELEASLSVIEQTRMGSPDPQLLMTEALPKPKAQQQQNVKENLSLVMPAKTVDLQLQPPTRTSSASIDGALAAPEPRKKISHVRSSTEGCDFFEAIKQQNDNNNCALSSRTPSVSENGSDDESTNRPPMLRKKSGELVRPALRSTSRRRPSSMPGTPTFGGKAVHFDAHLEHVRHFLQVDRPLAVSAGSSPVESQYESDTEFPFNDNSHQKSRSPSFEWEITVANFPAETPARLRLPVRVERIFLSADNKMLVGTVAVANLSFHKSVVARFTLDYWKTTSEVVAEYNNDIRRKQEADGYDRFNFNIKLADQANLEAKTMFFCVRYCVNGQEYWDNNNNTNFQIDFKKKAKPQNGKRGSQGAASKPALPRSNKKSVSSADRPRSMPVAFDDFRQGFDTNYEFSNFGKPVHDYLGESPTTPVRLKGVKSTTSIPSNNYSSRISSAGGQAFGNRYDFGASLSAAMSNSTMSDRTGLSPRTLANSQQSRKQSAGKSASTSAGDAPRSTNNAAISSNQSHGIQGGAPLTHSLDRPVSPRTTEGGGPPLQSQSYHELLDKYCFFGSAKSSPQPQDGPHRGRSGQYDGNDDGYIYESRSPTPSPPMRQTLPERYTPPPPPAQQKQKSPRSGSPAPMTGLAKGTSPIYPYSMHFSFPFNETHAATAIRG